jgi:hypothetical protein
MKFEFKSFAEQTAMSNEDLAKYKASEIKYIQDVLAESEKNTELTAEQSKKLSEQAEILIKQGNVIAELQKRDTSNHVNSFKSELKKTFEKELDGLKNFGKNSTISLEVKATQTYGDIDQGSDFAQMRPGITDSPIRRAGVIRSLFSTIPVSTEYYKYSYQDTVVRDAQNVAKCAPWVTSNTKETIKVDTIQTKMIKDIIRFCRQFIADYPFMESRIRKLINESVALRIDQQLLLGTGLGEQTFSINSVASEFSATNVDAPIGASVELATMVDLILAMRTQITVLGQENFFIPDTVMVNLLDWFTLVESRKDTQGNYIDSRVSYINGMPYIGGMLIVTSPLVANNTMYVFDSTKGEIVDRRLVTIEIATQNASEWESEIASLKAYERLNFLVINENSNAFMKCSDVEAAIVAITKP